MGISAYAYTANSDIDIVNHGDITATSSNHARGIEVGSVIDTSIGITNSGAISLTAGTIAEGIFAYGYANSPVSITNSGAISLTAGLNALGIHARGADAAPVTIVNSGNISVEAAGSAFGIYAVTYGSTSPITIVNTGNVQATGGNAAYGIDVSSADSPIVIVNTGSASAAGPSAVVTAGIQAESAATTTIVNAGEIYSDSGLAINVTGGAARIYNTGVITGFVTLADQDDLFINRSGGVFEAEDTSFFQGGTDLFINQSGGTVHTANDPAVAEATSFVNLETFQNQGLISTVDGATGDTFTIANTPGGKDLNFAASGDSTLAVDAFLRGPANSSADQFIVQGNVSGVTTVEINNTNAGPGVYNPAGFKVVTVTGTTPTGNEFQLAEPVDTGFFDYDLYFTPTGSGFWSLKSFPGGGAYLLPQLLTAAQDIWHEGASTWFDRTADLRVLLNGGTAPTAYGPNGAEPPQGTTVTPAVWARGSGGWLGRDDSASTTAYGRTYTYNLDRDLQTMDFQVGLDLGQRDVLSQGDAFVFGVLGGFVQANLDYDHLVRQFNFKGGQVGAYATYLNGGLFVDTLFDAHLYGLDPNGTVGFPDGLDASTLGLRTDTGYRFGGFRGGPFLEPLATIEVLWADIDGFSRGGNTVSFSDDPNVRGRLGLRAGTTLEAWEGTTLEPFVITSLWGNLSDNNKATLVSTGTTFRFQDDLQDVWGEVSAGANFFNVAAGTTVFAKVDVAFGDDITGVGGKAGMRVAW